MTMAMAIRRLLRQQRRPGRRSRAFGRIPFVGAEVEYIDFGSGNGNNGYYSSSYYYGRELASEGDGAVRRGISAAAGARSSMSTARSGVARLQTNDAPRYYDGCPNCRRPLGCSSPTTIGIDQTNTKFAYGAGVQGEMAGFRLPRGIRAHQLGVRQSRGVHGQRHLDVLAERCLSGASL